ncbi:hypothetical protein SAMN02746098_03149 [Desulfosporosinus lacus DSM 15449]|uniref:Uncharacterized protein n=1 Tax=Desulfosporosinus lacus DSM 15449 TaxID=1121420 RepID=A0A1M5ZCB0_9FIRM|nr:hypothetical protein SAMN02746098_03149 [Desulfosporosinus lacus DSM 15449]
MFSLAIDMYADYHVTGRLCSTEEISLFLNPIEFLIATYANSLGIYSLITENIKPLMISQLVTFMKEVNVTWMFLKRYKPMSLSVFLCLS